MNELDFSAIKRFPFQVQISYTDTDGSKWLRVVTQQLEVCYERSEALQKAGPGFYMMIANKKQKSAGIARAGDLK